MMPRERYRDMPAAARQKAMARAVEMVKVRAERQLQARRVRDSNKRGGGAGTRA